MSMPRLALCLTLISTTLFGCVSQNGLMVNGKCVVCVVGGAGFQSGTRIENGSSPFYITKAEYPVFNWLDFMLVELRAKNISDFDFYADGYLEYKEGVQYSRLRGNEFEYRRRLDAAKGELAGKVSDAKLDDSYQVTVPLRLDEYNFDRKSFSIPHPDRVEVTTAYVDSDSSLPYMLTVNFENSNAFPAWSVDELTAENIMKRRDGNRSFYVRYVFSNIRRHSSTIFASTVKQIQIIEAEPSIVTADKKEMLQVLARIDV